MIWNVWICGTGANSITPFNIFDHDDFRKDVQTSMTECGRRDDFTCRIRQYLLWYFWGKHEWSIVVNGRTIDVYDQVHLNFEKFIDYLWEVRNGAT